MEILFSLNYLHSMLNFKLHQKIPYFFSIGQLHPKERQKDSYIGNLVTKVVSCRARSIMNIPGFQAFCVSSFEPKILAVTKFSLLVLRSTELNCNAGNDKQSLFPVSFPFWEVEVWRSGRGVGEALFFPSIFGCSPTHSLYILVPNS